MADFTKLSRALKLKCVAVVGDSRRTNLEWIRGQLDFIGRLYSVQVNPETVEDIKALGVENYSSLLNLPEPIATHPVIAWSPTVS